MEHKLLYFLCDDILQAVPVVHKEYITACGET